MGRRTWLRSLDLSPLSNSSVAVSGSGIATVSLAESLAKLGVRPPDASAPRLNALQELRGMLTKKYAGETDVETKAATALALSAVHRELHGLFKPDELARSYATKVYRSNNPAANAAAEAIVIYPTNR